MTDGVQKEYVLGSSDREIERLAYQHEVWLDETAPLWDRSGIGIGCKVVDLGCGPGFCTKALARLVGHEGHVHAVDSSDKFAAIVTAESEHATNITFHHCDVDETPLEESSIDAVFARWLFCFLARPEKAISESLRILKPGGKIVILDYFNYLAADVFPKHPQISKLFEAYLADVESHGGNYDVGEILPSMLVDCGFEIESLSPITRIARPGSRVWKWVELFHEVTLPRLVKNRIWTDNDRIDFEGAWSEVRDDPASFFFSPPMIGIIAVKV